MALLFCKIVDELNTLPGDLPEFRISVEEPSARVASRIHTLFNTVKQDYNDVFRPEDVISLDDESLRYVIGELQNFVFTEATRDAIGEAFEVFIGPATRGEEGQFFTPRNVVKAMVELLNPKPGEHIIDPACGSGGFLIASVEHMWSILEVEANAKSWSERQLERRRKDIASRCIRGVDKDSFLAKVTKAYMAIIGDGRGGIFCDDSLTEPESWNEDTRASIKLKKFDLVLTNPPFGSKIKVRGEHKLAQYRLAKRWRKPKKDGTDWSETETLLTEQSPQILFIERCIQFLKPGGRLAIILPESVFGMPVYGYVVKYLFENFRLRAFVSLPEEVFQPSTHAKTCIVILENCAPAEDDEIQMAIADWCGHDSRGNPTVRTDEEGNRKLLDDLPDIALNLRPRLPWNAIK